MTTITHPNDTVQPATSTEAAAEPDIADPVPAVEPVTVDGQMRDYPVEALVPHPDNPRSELGDLSELVRSIKAQGVLQPLLILPAGDDGRHLIVAGHRRHAAAIEAKRATVPAVVRDLTPAGVIEAFLVENGQRSDLSVSEEVHAIERLVDLSGGKLTVARVSRRIGRSQNWVRARMALCALAPPWRQAIDRGELTLTAGEAAASVADLGPDHVEALCRQFQGNSWGDHARSAELYRARIQREAAYDAEVAKAKRRRGAVVLTSDDNPVGYLPLDLFLTDEATKAHRREPCHALLIERTAYEPGYERTWVCTDPERHTSRDDTDSDPGSDGDDSEASEDHDGAVGGSALPRGPLPEPKGPDLDSSHLKRQGRLARLRYATELWAKPRGGVSQAQATRFALTVVIYEAAPEALRLAADILDIPEDDRGWRLPEKLLARADSPAALARISAAVAAGCAEVRMYHGYDGPICRDWMALLVGAGWEPDTWTAAILDQQAEAREQAGTDQPDADGSPSDPVDGRDQSAGDPVEDAAASPPDADGGPASGGDGELVEDEVGDADDAAVGDQEATDTRDPQPAA